MAKNSKWRTALLVLAGLVLVAGSFAWVFPRETAGVAGQHALPTLSLCALFLALALAAEWRLLRGLLAVLAITLVLGWNRSSTTSTSHFAGACLGFLVMLTIGRAFGTPRRLRFAMLAFLSGGMLALLLGLAGSSVRTETLMGSRLPVNVPAIKLRLAGLSSRGDVNPNALAAAVLLVAPLGVTVLVLRTGEKIDWLGLMPVAFTVVVTSAVILVICASRSAWIAIWLILVGLLVRGMRSWLCRIVTGAIVVAPLFVAASSVLFLSQEAFLQQASNLWTSAGNRAEIITQGVDRWRASPWLGIGVNEFRSVYRPKSAATDIVHAHNIFLQTALDVGAAGSAAYWGLLALLLVRATQAARGPSRAGRSAAVGSALCLVAISLFGLSDAVALGSKMGIFQWMAGGLVLAAWRVQSGSTEQSAQ